VQTGVYDIPALHARIEVAVTNTGNVAPYRGAGQPEAVHVLERLVDAAAAQLGADRLDLRARNLIARAQFPYRTAAGALYDSGDIAEAMRIARELSDWDGFGARRAASEARGLLRGIGLANYVQVSGGNPHEWGRVDVHAEGWVELRVGTHSHGQGHETTLPQILADRLGLPMELVRFVQGDTARIPNGAGTHGSRSMFKAGTIVVQCAERIEERLKAVVAEHLEVSVADIRREGTHYAVGGTDLGMTLFEAARIAEAGDGLPDDLRGPVGAEVTQQLRLDNFPGGCHVCEVEVDPETGVVRILRYVAVDDAGRVINPLLAAGQIHGGIAQGIGQALLERCVFDGTSGQLLSASFMDYGLPRADDLPAFVTHLQEVPSPTNPLGVKGIGESGATGAPPAVVSAVTHAIAPGRALHLDMPLTPERIWRAINEA
jgi:carbon-monoxide dehydrogenase large subunit